VLFLGFNILVRNATTLIHFHKGWILAALGSSTIFAFKNMEICLHKLQTRYLYPPTELARLQNSITSAINCTS
jgi:hypothetical protein